MVNKKILTIIILTLVLIGGLYYFTTEGKKDVSDEDLPEEDIVEVRDEEISEEEWEIAEIAVGEEAPNFTLENLAAEEISLQDYRGKIVLLNFWATWCKYCDIEMPDLQKLDNENDDLVVLAVNVMEPKETVEEYMEKGGYDFQVALDKSGDIAKIYLVSSFPRTYFIDKDGTLLGGVPGMMTYAQMNQILDAIRENE